MPGRQSDRDAIGGVVGLLFVLFALTALAIAFASRCVGSYCFPEDAKKAKALAWILAIAVTLALLGFFASGDSPRQDAKIPRPVHRSSEELAAGAALLKGQGVEARRRVLERWQAERVGKTPDAALRERLR